MTSEQVPAPFVGWGATAHGLSAGIVRLEHDRDGNAFIRLNDAGSMGIRVQMAATAVITPDALAPALERDRRGLLRLAEIATQLAGEIRQAQREGGAS